MRAKAAMAVFLWLVLPVGAGAATADVSDAEEDFEMAAFEDEDEDRPDSEKVPLFPVALFSRAHDSGLLRAFRPLQSPIRQPSSSGSAAGWVGVWSTVSIGARPVSRAQAASKSRWSRDRG